MLSDQHVGQERIVNAINLAEGKARFSELVARAEAGEEIVVARRGKAVARISSVDPAVPAVDFDAILAEVQTMPRQQEDSGTFVRRMRDGDRY